MTRPSVGVLPARELRPTRPKPAARSRARLRLGLTIGPDRITAVQVERTIRGLRPTRVCSRPIALPAPEDNAWPDLVDALRDLIEELGVDGASVSIALLRTIAHAKVITVPRLRRPQLRALVQRNARRYFVAVPNRLIADAVFLDGESPKTGRSLAAVADERLVDMIYRSVLDAGLRPEAFTAAALALTNAVVRLIPAARRSPVVVAICSAGWKEGIGLEHGVPHSIQPWDKECEDLVQSIDRLAPAGDRENAKKVSTIILAGSDERRRLAAHHIRASGGVTLDTPELCDLDPDALAAFGITAMPGSMPYLQPAALVQKEQRAERRCFRSLVVAAVVILSLAAATHLFGVRRELNSVVQERGAIAPQVAKALELRNAAQTVRARLGTMTQLDQNSVRWAPALASLAQALPNSAYLVSLTADGLQVRLAGVATSASGVVPALQASPLFRDVTLTNTRQQDATNDGQLFDLTLALQIASPLAAQPDQGAAPLRRLP